MGCRLLLSLLPLALAAQVQSDFYPQAGAVIGRYQMYVVQVCNASDTSQRIMGASVWREAQERGTFTPQLTSVLLAEQDYGSKTSSKAWWLRGLGWGTAAGSGLAGSKLVGNVSTDTGIGKAIVIAGPTLATVCTAAAEAVAKVPEKPVDPRIDRILPGILEIAPHACVEYVMWGVPKGG